MAEDNVASMFQSPEEFDNLLQILKQSINEQVSVDLNSSPVDSPENANQLSESPTSSESSCYTDEETEENYTTEQINEIQNCLEQNLKEPPIELRHYSLIASFGPRRKPEMTFILSISNFRNPLPFSEKCSIEINGDEINTNYDYFSKKPRSFTNKIWKTGYCVHARLYLRDDNGIVQIKNHNPPPLSFVYSKDRFSSFKDGQLKVRIRENLTMKHLPVSNPQLLIQFSLTYQGEKLLETERLPISFESTKKKRYAETTDIIFSPSKIPSSVAPLLESPTKRTKSEPSSVPVQNQFPTASAIWSSTSPVDIINYLEAQMMSTQQINYVPTLYMLVPAQGIKSSAQGITTNNLVMAAPPQMMYQQPPPKSQKKFPEVTDLYSNITINGAFSQPLGEVLPTMMPKSLESRPPHGKEAHVPIDPHQMECWLDSLSS